jgi:hypothetical protein
MTAKWKVVLEKGSKNINVGEFETKQDAKKEIEYRNTLCRHLQLSPDIPYTIKKIGD